MINRVPGNFHISSHAYREIIYELQNQGLTLDYSYKLNHLSFGKEEDMKSIKSSFPEQGVLSPIDGLEVNAMPNNEGKMMPLDSKFYLIAIPSIFKDSGILGSEYHAY